MSYAGNPSLTRDVQERITNTFQQTLDLVTQGKDQEALVGCEFILRMDPTFGPATNLLERLRASERPVRVDDLKAGGPASAQAPDDFPELDDFDDLGDLESLDDLGGLGDLGEPSFGGAAVPAAAPPAATPAPAAAPATSASGLAAVVEDLLEKRSFEQILQIADNQKDEVAKDPAVQKLVEAARAGLESDAYVKAFVKSAAQARAAGQLEEMESFLGKARSLDPQHPEVLGFEPTEPAAPAADDDLAALQQQSLELDAGVAEELPELDALPDDEPGFEDLSFEPEAKPPLDIEEYEPEAADDDEILGAFAPPEAVPEPPMAEPPTAEPPMADSGEAEGGDRIAQLLAEGQGIFEQGEYQAAIDVWSRIFLIDIDNSEASNRIEQARSKKSEIERQAEEVFHEGVAQIEQSSLDEAQETLRRVLELQPSHSVALEYLQQLEAGQVPTIRAASEAEATSDLDAFGEGLDSGESGPSMEAAVERDRVVVVKKTDKKLIAIGGLVAVLVIGGIYFLATGGLDDLFPNREAPPAAVRVDPIERATKMHDGGNTENAIILLERIQPQNPSYEDAQALAAQWKAHVETPLEDTPAGPSQEQIERLDLLLTAAREAHAQRNFIRAKKYFDRASKISPLSAEALDLKRDCEQALKPLAAEIGLFEATEYAQVIPLLWRQRESDPANPDVELLLINSYYNLALTDLQRGDTLGAAKKLQEALEVQPGNQELERMRLFAQTYVDRPKDLLYRIFVKYLPSRS